MNLGDILQSMASGYSQGYQQKYAYNASGLVEFIGIAQRGLPTSAGVWTIMKYTYDVSNNITGITMAPKNSIWDDYPTLTYA